MRRSWQSCDEAVHAIRQCMPSLWHWTLFAIAASPKIDATPAEHSEQHDDQDDYAFLNSRPFGVLEER